MAKPGIQGYRSAGANRGFGVSPSNAAGMTPSRARTPAPPRGWRTNALFTTRPKLGKAAPSPGRKQEAQIPTFREAAQRYLLEGVLA